MSSYRARAEADENGGPGSRRDGYLIEAAHILTRMEAPLWLRSAGTTDPKMSI